MSDVVFLVIIKDSVKKIVMTLILAHNLAWNAYLLSFAGEIGYSLPLLLLVPPTHPNHRLLGNLNYLQQRNATSTDL